MGLFRRLEGSVRRRPLLRWGVWLFVGFVLFRLVLLGAMFLWSLVLLAEDRELSGSAAELRTFDLISLVITVPILWLGDRAWLRWGESDANHPRER